MSHDLPADVVQAIHDGRKIEAIKRLREARGIGLKEAKEAVDAYVTANPHLVPAQSSGGGLGFLVILAAGILIAWLIYQQQG